MCSEGPDELPFVRADLKDAVSMIAVITDPQLSIAGNRQATRPRQVPRTRATSPDRELVSPIGTEDPDVVRGVVGDKDAAVVEQEKPGNGPEDVRIASLVDASDGQVDGTAETRGRGLSVGEILLGDDRDEAGDRRARNRSETGQLHGSAKEWLILFCAASSAHGSPNDVFSLSLTTDGRSSSSRMMAQM